MMRVRPSDASLYILKVNIDHSIRFQSTCLHQIVQTTISHLLLIEADAAKEILLRFTLG